jgi:hypothetical protein
VTLHDRARRHTALAVQPFLASNNRLRTYLPDLALCDVPFLKMKIKLKVHSFGTIEVIETESQMALKTVTQKVSF